MKPKPMEKELVNFFRQHKVQCVKYKYSVATRDSQDQ